MKTITIALCLGFAIGTPAFSNSLVAPGPRPGIAGSGISAKPSNEWNKLSRSDGKNVEIWTIDGDSLNKVTFFGGIANGMPLVREVSKKHQPLPKVASNMLMTDIPTLLETTYRVQYAVSQMSIDSQEPVLVSGHKGIRFTYSFTRGDDEVQRKGEATGALINDKLYLVTYEAPALYFFNKDIEKYRALAATLSL